MEEYVCLNCGKIILDKKSVKRNFCTKTCQQDYQYKKYIEEWKNGKQDGIRGNYGISRYIRKYLFNKYNCKCQLCGWGEVNKYTNLIPLELHHIDGNYKNNSENNLQLLCPNCHSLTESYKSHNKNGRKIRKKYTK